MNRLTVLGDIAGRVSIDTAGAPRVTAASVAVATADEHPIRTELTTVSKWSRCTRAEAEQIVELLQSQSVAVGVMSINKDTDAWRKFAQDSCLLQKAIVRESRHPAGWAKPSVLLAYQLLGGSAAMATGHALRITPMSRILGADGLEHIERRLIFDSDISGDENVEVFRSFWERKGHHSRFAQLGVRMAFTDVSFSTEQYEPLLLLADYAAGLAHSMLLPDPGRIPMPIPFEQAKELAGRLRATGKLVINKLNFSNSYDEIFGEIMSEARSQSAN